MVISGKICTPLARNSEKVNKNPDFPKIRIFYLRLKNELGVLAAGTAHAKPQALPQGTRQEDDQTWPV